MENKPNHKPFWMLFTAELTMSAILGLNFQTNQVPFWIQIDQALFWSGKDIVIIVVVFIWSSCLAQKWKPESPFLCPPGNKGGTYLETWPLPKAQRVWTGHQVPLAQAPNQLRGRYSKWEVAGRPLRSSSLPWRLEEESHGEGENQRASCCCFPAGSAQDNLGSGCQRCRAISARSGTSLCPSSLLTARASGSATLLWENQATQPSTLTSSKQLTALPSPSIPNTELSLGYWESASMIWEPAYPRYLVPFDARTHQKYILTLQELLLTPYIKKEAEIQRN